MERDWGRVLAPMLMNRSASMHAACSGPRCRDDGWPVPVTGYEAGQMQHGARLEKWHKAQATAFWLVYSTTSMHRHTWTTQKLSPNRFGHHCLGSEVSKWILASVHLLLLEAPLEQCPATLTRTERKILSLRSHGEAHSRTESCNTDSADTRSL